MAGDSNSTWLGRLRTGLSKSRNGLVYQLKSALASEKITEETWEEIEVALLGADIGVEVTADIVDTLRSRSRSEMITSPEGLAELLRSELVAQFSRDESDSFLPGPGEKCIFLIVGVNGTGKTTTIGKLAASLKAGGATVTLVAADTFRAAAIEQLQEWADRSGADLVRQERGADPAAVVYDGISSMRARGTDVLIVDTAGRLHVHVNLMEELKKVKRVALREAHEIPVRTFMVVDGTTGQNGIAQAIVFHEDLGLDATIVTKLDGTAKGGIVFAIHRRLGVPVAMIGFGEGIEDLKRFDASEYVSALLD